MRAPPIVLLATSLVGLTACGGSEPGPEAAGSAMSRSPIVMHVSCDSGGSGIGARINPWRAHSGRGSTFDWKLRPIGKTAPVQTTLSAVDVNQWPFPDTSYTWTSGDLQVTAEPGAPKDVHYHYRLRFDCPTDTITIDPIVIIDHTLSPDTT